MCWNRYADFKELYNDLIAIPVMIVVNPSDRLLSLDMIWTFLSNFYFDKALQWLSCAWAILACWNGFYTPYHPQKGFFVTVLWFEMWWPSVQCITRSQIMSGPCSNKQGSSLMKTSTFFCSEDIWAEQRYAIIHAARDMIYI